MKVDCFQCGPQKNRKSFCKPFRSYIQIVCRSFWGLNAMSARVYRKTTSFSVSIVPCHNNLILPAPVLFHAQKETAHLLEPSDKRRRKKRGTGFKVGSSPEPALILPRWKRGSGRAVTFCGHWGSSVCGDRYWV